MLSAGKRPRPLLKDETQWGWNVRVPVEEQMTFSNWALHWSHCRLWRKLLAKKAAGRDKREGAAEQDGEKERGEGVL